MPKNKVSGVFDAGIIRTAQNADDMFKGHNDKRKPVTAVHIYEKEGKFYPVNSFITYGDENRPEPSILDCTKLASISIRNMEGARLAMEVPLSAWNELSQDKSLLGSAQEARAEAQRVTDLLAHSDMSARQRLGVSSFDAAGNVVQMPKPGDYKLTG